MPTPSVGPLVGGQDFFLYWLVLARVGGVVAVAPVVSAGVVPAPVRAALSLLLALAVLPAARAQAAPVPEAVLPYVGLLGRELLVGLVIGFVARAVFSAAEMAGSLVDLQMGFSLGSVVDPLYGEPAAVVGTLLNALAMLLFLLAGGVEVLVLALAGSYTHLPIGLQPPGAAPGVQALGGAVQTATGALGWALAAALQVAAPAVAFGLILNLAFGLIGRAMPQLNVLQAILPAQVLGGVLALLLAMPMLTATFLALAAQAGAWIGGLRP